MKKGIGLKLIIFYKAVLGFLEIVFSLIFIRFYSRSVEETLIRLAVKSNLDINGYIVHTAIKKAGALRSSTVIGIAVFILLIGILNVIEAGGLSLKRRWAEWLTVIATSLLIPIEIYEVFRKFTSVKLLILVINVVIVYYLAKHKELFKGKKAARHWIKGKKGEK